jgi:HD superfamily phosphohydrolase
MIESIHKKQPDLGITSEIISLVGIAGLCHDLGHLLFSHLFDDHFIEQLSNFQELKSKTKNYIHENRSVFLLNYLVDMYNINLNKDQLKVIGDLINPKESEYCKWKGKYQIGKWLFQIISNPLNSIDVDKFDYIVRDTKAIGLKYGFDYSRIIEDAMVIDHKICYSSQCSEDIYQMFFIRYRLHRQIYNNESVKAIEILVVKLLLEIEKELNISQYIFDAEKMIELVDGFIWHQKLSPSIKKIILDIDCARIPELVYQEVSLYPFDFDEAKLKQTFDQSQYSILKFKVGYVGGKSNPLNKVSFYNLKTKKIISENKIKSFSLLITQKHQEYFLRVYCLDLSVLDQFVDYFDKQCVKILSDKTDDFSDNQVNFDNV